MKIKRVLTLMLSASMLMSSVVPTYAMTEETSIETIQETEDTIEVEETEIVTETESEAGMDTLEVQDIQWGFDELETGDTQTITIGMNHTEGVKSAVLKGEAEDKGAGVEYTSTRITDREIIFEIQHSDADWYSFQTLELQLEDEVMTMDVKAHADLTYMVTDLYKGEAVGSGFSRYSLKRSSNRYTGVNGADDVFVIVLDPGHDPVCNTRGVINGVWEIELNWEIAVAMKEALEGYKNVEVYINRVWDECPEETDGVGDLEARVLRAVNLKADLFVSLHNNVLDSGGLQTSARGAEVFVTNYSGYQAEASGVAAVILANLEEMGLRNRGIKKANYGNDAPAKYDDGSEWDYYAVTRHSTLNGIPSILIEHAFMDNAIDLEILRNEDKVVEIGQRNAQAIIDYYELEVDNGDDVETDDDEQDGSEGDDAVNDSELSGNVKFDQTSDEWLNVVISDTKASFEIKDVYLKLWSQTAEEDSAKEYPTTFENNTWNTLIDMKQESMTAGAYKAAVYCVDENETSHLVDTVDLNLVSAQNLVGVFSAEQISEQILMTIRNVVLKDSQSSVSFEVLSSANAVVSKLNGIKDGNNYVASVAKSNFKQAGVYYVDAYANGADGRKVLLKRTQFEIKPDPVTGTVKADVLNVRSGAGTGYSRVGTVKKGAKVTIKASVTGSDSYTWYQISSPYSGYVRSDYIAKDATTSTGTSTGSTTTTTTKKTGTVTADVLNVRSGAGTNYSKIGTLNYGVKVDIVSENGSWYQIKYTVNGVSKTGYVHKDYMKVTVSTVETESTPEPTPSTKPETESTPEPTPPAQTTTVKGIVNCDALNVRSGASTSSSKVGMIYRNASVEILSQEGSWYKVKCTINGSTKTAYVCAEYITKTTSSSSGSNTGTTGTVTKKGVVNCGALNVRSGAGTGYSKTDMIYQNTQVEILSQSGSWYKVKYTVGGSTKTGYVHTDYITKVNS